MFLKGTVLAQLQQKKYKLKQYVIYILSNKTLFLFTRTDSLVCLDKHKSQ